MRKLLFCIAIAVFALTACNGDIAPSSDTSADKVSSTASSVEETSSADISDTVSTDPTSSTDVNDTASTESAIKKNATVIIDYADNTLYDEVSFAEDGANYNLIFFTNVAVKNFTLLEMDESEVLQISDALWCIDELTPEKPVIVSTWLNDATISRGISYTDQNGKEHVFSIVLSMKDESLSLVEFKEQTTKDESAPSDEPKEQKTLTIDEAGPLDEPTEQKTLTIDEAFEAYLKGEIPAVYIDGRDKYIYEQGTINFYRGIGSYELRDVTGDGVPEMLLGAVGQEILMYQNGKLVTIYVAHTNGMNGPIDLLENGAMFEIHKTTGNFYYYTTFNADGSANLITFDLIEYPEDQKEKNAYYFEGEKVTKQEFDELTKDIFAAAEKKAELNWIEWTPQ